MALNPINQMSHAHRVMPRALYCGAEAQRRTTAASRIIPSRSPCRNPRTTEAAGEASHLAGLNDPRGRSPRAILLAARGLLCCRCQRPRHRLEDVDGLLLAVLVVPDDLERAEA